LIEDIRRMVANCPESILGIRDRAIILCGFAMAARRKEAAELAVRDLEWTESGVIVTCRRSKTDQGGEGYTKAIAYGSDPDTCPVRALRAWLDAAPTGKNGPVFRGVDRHGNVSSHRLYPGSIARIIKTAARRAGLDAGNISGHSLRSGMASQAARNGVDERSIARTTQHKSLRVLRRYIHAGTIFEDNASGRLGL
ncbi:MAG: site-specific integrase, partial [Terracidiphilus sp.]